MSIWLIADGTSKENSIPFFDLLSAISHLPSALRFWESVGSWRGIGLTNKTPFYFPTDR